MQSLGVFQESDGVKGNLTVANNCIDGCKNLPKFCFDFMLWNYTLTELNKLYIKETSQKTYTPEEILKEQKRLLSYFLIHGNSLCYSTLPPALK